MGNRCLVRLLISIGHVLSIQRAKRRRKLRDEHFQVMRPHGPVLDNQGTTGQSGVDANGLLSGVDGGLEHVIPDGQREPEIHVLSALEAVVDPVEVRRNEDRPYRRNW